MLRAVRAVAGGCERTGSSWVHSLWGGVGSVRTASAASSVEVNGRVYSLARNAKAAVILLDGSEQEYWEQAVCLGHAPHASRLFYGAEARGCSGVVDSCMPTFTNPNNVAVICGVPPSTTGITGNFFINSDGEEVMMNDPALLRCGSILAAASHAGTCGAQGHARVLRSAAKGLTLPCCVGGHRCNLNLTMQAPTSSPPPPRTSCWGCCPLVLQTMRCSCLQSRQPRR